MCNHVLLSAALSLGFFLAISGDRLKKVVPASSEPSKYCSNTSCFMFVTEKKLNWSEANTWCKRSGAALATIRNEDEQRFIKDRLPEKKQGFWIGLNSLQTKPKKVYKWVDGTLSKFTSWHKGEPSNTIGEHCVELYKDDTNRDANWNNNKCGNDLYFICSDTKGHTSTPSSRFTKSTTETLNTCPVLRRIRNGILLSSLCGDPKKQRTSGVTCTYYCSFGYKVEGAHRKYCAADGTWKPNSTAPHCKDIDECQSKNGGCSHKCHNHPGNYSCSCFPGYKLNADKHGCTGISCNISNGGCDQRCKTNLTGPRICSCNDGFVLAQDGKKCKDIDECQSKNGGCSHKCHNHPGNYSCSCFSGYKLNADKHGCTGISCNISNGGCDQRCKTNLTGRRICSCNDGFVLAQDGKKCKDIDECQRNKGGCSHRCHNHPGNYSCSCNRGYKLNADKHGCTDIDECSGSSGCSHRCQNRQGSYVCSCNRGYKLNADKHRCNDIDECRKNNGGCSDKCSNKLGSYTCSCNPGYELMADKHGCQDINECKDQNGGCQHKCINRDGGYYCYCNHGYSSHGFDSKYCRDIDECTTFNPCQHTCNNSIGSYTCSCHKGYNLASNKLDCEDYNECLDSNGNCEHYCLNYPGGRVCSCKEGFKLNPDQQTCSDINECSNNNGGCSHNCHNNNGSFSCSCRAGYYLGWDQKACKVIQCPYPPYIPGGFFTCEDGVGYERTYKTKCRFKCNHGYILKGTATILTCDIKGEWTGSQPKCERVKCAGLKELNHSSVYPLTCLKKVDWGSTCHFTCSQGYALTGPSSLACLHTGKWSENQVGQKCEDNEPPVFNQTCPQNIYRKADNGKAFATVSWTPPTATDNSGQVTMSTIPSDLTVPYAFNIGKRKVTYTATDSNNLKVNCSFNVVVQDLENPRLVCPPTSTVIGTRPYVNVTWGPPNITDNSGEVVSVRSSLKNGTEVSFGVYPVTYTARDKAGNTGVCSFKVIVQKKQCNKPQKPANGSITCDSWLFGGFCTVSCQKGFGFAIPPAPKYVCGLDGDWHPGHKPLACSELVDANKVVISIQLHFTSLPCTEQTPNMFINSIVIGFVVASISNCAQNSLRCIHTVSSHCDSLGVINVNANISVEALSRQPLYNNTRDILNTIKKEKKKFESQLYITLSMQSQTTAICNQPGMVSSGQYCVRCPVDTYHNGSRCEKCPVGTSQPKEGQTQCVKSAVLHTKTKSL